MRWKVLKSTEVFTAGFFRMRKDECELPDGRVMPRYYVMEFPDWVNVVPVTPDGKMVLVEQYRHAADGIFLEIPGGSTHPGAYEDPCLAGQRELLEETGYRPEQMVYCGHHFPNPALQNNKVHTYLALGCTKVAEPQLDPFEDLVTKLLPVADVYMKWRKGEMKHSIIASSLGIALDPLRERGLIS